MKHLNRSIMEDYEILSSRPERLCAVQFGADARLLGGVDRMLDEANRAGANVGAALVDTDGGEFAGHLKRQAGMFTVFVRGEADEKEVHREQVVQSVLRALDPEADDAALMALARDGGIRFLILSIQDVCGCICHLPGCFSNRHKVKFSFYRFSVFQCLFHCLIRQYFCDRFFYDFICFFS